MVGLWLGGKRRDMLGFFETQRYTEVYTEVRRGFIGYYACMVRRLFIFFSSNVD
jgi:hypothetical protein